jgi:SAM-dependent methyltransferase
MIPDLRQMKSVLTAIAAKYPPDLVVGQLSDIERISFHISLLMVQNYKSLSVCDLGGGIGLFSIGCAALGMKVTVIDDFQDEVNKQCGSAILELHKSYGVDVVSADVLSGPLPFPVRSLDAVTCFDSMEHWHRSPKKLFASVMAMLKPGGIFVLGVPNRANLRKRISVPLGYGKWSSMKDWYGATEFRGHVREPDVDDLHYIAHDLRIEEYRIYGRNWTGYSSPRSLVRIATYACDLPLRLFPSLCAEIYLVGKKS